MSNKISWKFFEAHINHLKLLVEFCQEPVLLSDTIQKYWHIKIIYAQIGRFFDRKFEKI